MWYPIIGNGTGRYTMALNYSILCYDIYIFIVVGYYTY